MIIHFIVNIICSFALLISGYYMRFHAPKDKEMKMGLRNGHSQSSMEAWKFANETCGKYWLIFAGIALVLNVISFLVYAYVSESWSEMINIFATLSNIGVFCSSTAVTRELQNKFDEKGIPKE